MARANAINIDDWLRSQEEKELLRFVTIGSVDDGKSTLIGRLLHDAHGLYQDQLDAVRRASVHKGSTRGGGSTAEIDFSLFTDGLLAEREQGITIDVAYRYFATEKRKFIIADTPGHVQYTRNMATGASTAEAAIILIDARLGVLPQTRRHAQIAALLGIPHVIACVNKMDLVGWSRERFEEIRRELDGIATKLSLQQKLHAIPVSALLGDNIVTKSAAMSSWWTGGTVLERLETIEVVASGGRNDSFRFPVQLVLRPGLDYRGFAGQIASGTIAKGDEVTILPSGKRTRVASVDAAGVAVDEASAPMSVALRLVDEIDVSRGDWIVRSSEAQTSTPLVSSAIEADVVWMSERALDPARTYLVKSTTRTVRATLEPIHGTDPETLSPCPADAIVLNNVARVRLHTRTPLVFDAYRDNRATGAFIVIDALTNDTVAAGMIQGVATTGSSGHAAAVSHEERQGRLGQVGIVVISGTREVALRVERGLFDHDRVAAVTESEVAARELARAGLIAILIDEQVEDAVLIDGERHAATDIGRVVDVIRARVSL